MDLDGEIIGVAGVLHTPFKQAFSSMTDEMRHYPKTIMKVGHKMRKILNSYNEDIYAVASDREDNSKAFLERVGFKHYDGEVYVWTR